MRFNIYEDGILLMESVSFFYENTFLFALIKNSIYGIFYLENKGGNYE